MIRPTLRVPIPGRPALEPLRDTVDAAFAAQLAARAADKAP
jgi:hypothetical protein